MSLHFPHANLSIEGSLATAEDLHQVSFYSDLQGPDRQQPAGAQPRSSEEQNEELDLKIASTN